MLGEEGEIYPHKYSSEVNFCSGVVYCVSCKEGESVNEGPHNSKYSPH